LVAHLSQLRMRLSLFFPRIHAHPHFTRSPANPRALSAWNHAQIHISRREKQYGCLLPCLYFIRSFVPFSSFRTRLTLELPDLCGPKLLGCNFVTDTGKAASTARFQSTLCAMGQLLPGHCTWWLSVARHQADPGVSPAGALEALHVQICQQAPRVMEPS